MYYTTNWQVIEERISPESEKALPDLWFNSSDYLAQQFVWNVGYIDDLILRDRDTNGDSSLDERLYALTDLRFTVMALTNASGTIVERFRYEAHGRSTALSADFAPRTESFYDWQYRYTGRELDINTGFYYFRNRCFHSDLGRFISRDPIGYVDGMSLYRAYFVNLGLDANGFVTKNFRPSSIREIRRMPWKKQKIRTSQGQTWPIDQAGNQNYLGLRIACDCCKCKNCGCFSLFCTIDAHIQIIIDTDDWGIMNSPPFSIHQAYGHEQRHVKALLNAAIILAAVAEEEERREDGTTTKESCESSKLALERLGNSFLQYRIGLEESHTGEIGDDEFPEPMTDPDIRWDVARMGKLDYAWPGKPPKTNNCQGDFTSN